MRRANQNTAVMCDGDNALLSFGYDFCAEHEFGISGIQSAFGVSNDMNDPTINRYAVTRDGPLLFVEPPKPRGKEKRLYIVGGRFFRGDQTPEVFCERHRSYSEGKPEAWWDKDAFLFSVPTDFGKAKTFRAVHAALVAKDALIYLCGSNNPFGGSGLVIARRSTIEREHVASMEAAFRDTKALKDAAEATGIRARVEAWGERCNPGSWRSKPFFALSPRWLTKNFDTKDGPRKSSHPVIFWLNPTDQKNNEAGYFTVEELDQWIAGRGPIPMSVEAKRARARSA